MPTAVLNSASTPVLSYDLSLKLAPFKDATLTRTGPTTGIITIEMDPNHAGLIIDIAALGIVEHLDPATGVGEKAPTFAVVSGTVQAPSAAAGPQRDFAITLDSNTTYDCVYVVGLDPATTDKAGVPDKALTEAAAKNSGLTAESTPGGADSSTTNSTGNGGGASPLPIMVMIRKKRIPIPSGVSKTSSAGLIIVVAIFAFIAGYSIASLFK